MNDLRQDIISKLSMGMVANKDKILIEVFGLVIEECLIDNPVQVLSKYKGKMSCRVDHKGIETYSFDSIPMVEIYPLQTSVEDGIMTATQNYRVLYK